MIIDNRNDNRNYKKYTFETICKIYTLESKRDTDSTL